MVLIPMGICVAISDIAGSHAYLSRPMRSGVDMYDDCRCEHIIMVPVTVYYTPHVGVCMVSTHSWLDAVTYLGIMSCRRSDRCRHFLALILVGSLGDLPPPSSLVSVAVSAISSSLATVSVASSSSLPLSSHPSVTGSAVANGSLSSSLPLAQVSLPLHSSNAFFTDPSSSSMPGLILSPACDPFPRTLVTRVQAGHFVEMRDLLADNIALMSQLSSLHGTVPIPLSTVQRTRLREVPSLVSWMYCFCAYVAIRTPDALTRQMLAYARLIIREALRHGGGGWAEYDRVFRRQISINPALSWNTLEPSLQAATILGQRTSEGTLCTICQECDHSASQCALAPFQQQLQTPPVIVSSSAPASVYRPPRRPETLQRICVGWNKGNCSRPQCSFRHICATCHKAHKARKCPDTPADSEYKSLAGPSSRARK